MAWGVSSSFGAHDDLGLHLGKLLHLETVECLGLYRCVLLGVEVAALGRPGGGELSNGVLAVHGVVAFGVAGRAHHEAHWYFVLLALDSVDHALGNDKLLRRTGAASGLRLHDRVLLGVLALRGSRDATGGKGHVVRGGEGLHGCFGLALLGDIPVGDNIAGAGLIIDINHAIDEVRGGDLVSGGAALANDGLHHRPALQLGGLVRGRHIFST
mmetsp:Transcript_28448/g.56889  ORF Transcript_28448/g.56889 Transcript_28448/m.56889 type:complete len:213 (-) Transcript_28448:96-734(-)